MKKKLFGQRKKDGEIQLPIQKRLSGQLPKNVLPGFNPSQSGSAGRRQDPYSKPKDKDKVELNVLEWLLSLCKVSKRINSEKSLLDRGSRAILKQLDVFYLLNKLQEIDKLKSCLLNDDQNLIFNNLPKSSIHCVNDDYEPCVLKKMKKKAKCSEYDNARNVQRAYERLSHKELQTQLEKNLVRLYEEAKADNE